MSLLNRCRELGVFAAKSLLSARFVQPDLAFARFFVGDMDIVERWVLQEAGVGDIKLWLLQEVGVGEPELEAAATAEAASQLRCNL